MSDPIKKFYCGRDIFVTGGSGLMGKALLEKLLRSCNGVNRIFVLLRDLKGQTGRSRLQQVKDSKIFDRLRKEDPDSLDKLVAIPGDITALGLGMSEESEKLMENVSLVFHVAATVRFDEPISNAIMLNIRGTQEALKFAMRLKHLNRFIHISTAYTYPYKPSLYEEVYPAMADWRTMVKIAEKYDGELLGAFTNKILGVFPNSYTFTKHLAEQLVKDYSDKLPVAIIRPAIVHCCGVEPMEGWYDKLLAVMGMMTAVGTGIVRALYCRPSCVMDLVPLDDCIKIFVICPWWIQEKEAYSQLPVLNLSSSQIRTYSIETLSTINCELLEKYAFNKMLWLPTFGLTQNIWYYYFRLYTLHVFPAIIFDTLIKLSGRQPFFLHIQRRALASQRALQFFVFNDYMFFTKRLSILLEALKEYPDFRFDNLLHKTLHEIVEISVKGCRRYLVHEDDSSLPQAVRRYKIIKVADFIICRGFQCWLAYYILGKFIF
ncbi:unnamed protein product [Hermetia illucens]|uniref:Fatty acyl-CoA reductase n=1 Tax=Hermetia illucens TaxID=343691 RepID=A0A7R8UD95_HERIL|nr:fatty acyl-CoA reductase 1-like [Hermetia illucens]CAD7078549.1 unnamed protein product [Hermetia illucens]